MDKKLYMTDQELDKQVICSDVEIRQWRVLAKKRNWKWEEEKFIRMQKHMKYLRKILEFTDPDCESPPELIAYDALRRAGFNPTTQVRMYNYRVDQFFKINGEYNEDYLVVEIDGYGHKSIAEKKADNKKTSKLESNGIDVLRFSGSEVFKNPDKVAKTIIETIKKIEKKGGKNTWQDIDDFLGS